MNKSDVITEVATRSGVAKAQAGKAVDTLLDVVKESVAKGERVSLAGFGSFESRKRSARTARNPRTGEAVKVAATKAPAFKAGAAFKQVVSGKRAGTKAAGKKAGGKKAAAKKSTAKRGARR